MVRAHHWYVGWLYPDIPDQWRASVGIATAQLLRSITPHLISTASIYSITNDCSIIFRLYRCADRRGNRNC